MLSRLSPRTKTLLGVLIIAVVTVLAVLYAPPEGDANNVTGDLPDTPTVVVTNEISVLPLQQTVDLDGLGLHVSIKRATLATNFSDDHKRNGAYTVRVLVDIQNTTGTVLGYPFAENVHLVLPDGSLISTKLISVAASSLPKQAQSGFFDFPLQQAVALDQLKIQFMNNSQAIDVPFKG